MKTDTLGSVQGPAYSAHMYAAMQGAATCWFSEVSLSDQTVIERGQHTSRSMAPAPTLLALQRIIQERKDDTSGMQASCCNATTAALLGEEGFHWRGLFLTTEEMSVQ